MNLDDLRGDPSPRRSDAAAERADRQPLAPAREDLRTRRPAPNPVSHFAGNKANVFEAEPPHRTLAPVDGAGGLRGSARPASDAGELGEELVRARAGERFPEDGERGRRGLSGGKRS